MSNSKIVICMLLACTLLVLGGACGSQAGGGADPLPGTSVERCLPGQQDECACADGSRGAMVCDTSGIAFGTCSCAESAAPQAGVGAGAPSTGGTSGTAGVSDAGGTGGAAGVGGTGGTAGVGGTGGTAGAGGNAQAGTSAPSEPLLLAQGVRIREIAIYQAVKISLMENGEPIIARNAPVIAGKDALLRVFVETLPGFQPRPLTVELELAAGSEAAMPLSVTQMVAQSSSDAVLESTLNIDIPGASITNDLRYAVALREADGAMPAGDADPGARFPQASDQLHELGARSAGPLRVMLVPYRYNADGSGRLPAIEPAELDEYRDALRTFFPGSEIELELHDPVDYDGAVGPNSGWDQWLDFHCALRTQEDPDPKVLYYGTIAPRSSWQVYGGGTVGLSPVPSPAGNYGRCSVGMGFAGFATTLVHELGHALGLPHAPCGGAAGPDAYPYPGAKIGVWGYGLTSAELKDPDEFYDVMSYCHPQFISDYNYQRIFERIRYLNLQFDIAPQPSTRYARVLLSEGRATLRGAIDLELAPGGPDDQREVMLLDAEGGSLGTAQAYFFPFSEGDGGVYLIPAGGAAAARIPGIGTTQLH